jgi:coenzyme F420-reducing hydrogenase gamma subunit
VSHVSVVCCQVRGLCVGLITCLEKCGVYERDCEGPVAPWPGGADIFSVFLYGYKA